MCTGALEPASLREVQATHGHLRPGPVEDAESPGTAHSGGRPFESSSHAGERNLAGPRSRSWVSVSATQGVAERWLFPPTGSCDHQCAFSLVTRGAPCWARVQLGPPCRPAKRGTWCAATGLHAKDLPAGRRGRRLLRRGPFLQRVQSQALGCRWISCCRRKSSCSTRGIGSRRAVSSSAYTSIALRSALRAERRSRSLTGGARLVRTSVAAARTS